MSLIQIGSTGKPNASVGIMTSATPSHTDFQTICGVIMFHLPSAYDSEIALKDPLAQLYHIRTFSATVQCSCCPTQCVSSQ
jgi:hypothetical protein